VDTFSSPSFKHVLPGEPIPWYLLQSLIQARPTRWTYTMIPSPVPNSSTSYQVNLYHDTFSSPSFKHILPGEPIPWYLLQSLIQARPTRWTYPWYLLQSLIQPRLPGEPILDTLTSPSFNHVYKVNLFLIPSPVPHSSTSYQDNLYLDTFSSPSFNHVLPGNPILDTFSSPSFKHILWGKPIPSSLSHSSTF